MKPTVHIYGALSQDAHLDESDIPEVTAVAVNPDSTIDLKSSDTFYEAGDKIVAVFDRNHDLLIQRITIRSLKSKRGLLLILSMPFLLSLISNVDPMRHILALALYLAFWIYVFFKAKARYESVKKLLVETHISVTQRFVRVDTGGTSTIKIPFEKIQKCIKVANKFDGICDTVELQLTKDCSVEKLMIDIIPSVHVLNNAPIRGVVFPIFPPQDDFHIDGLSNPDAFVTLVTNMVASLEP